LESNHPYAGYSDPELVQRWLKGEEYAFDILYKRYAIRLLNTAFQKTNCRETSREFVQDVFMELYIHRDTLQLDTSLQPYLFTILRNKIYNYYRHLLVQQKYNQHISYLGEEREREPGEVVENKELRNKVDSVIQHLPPQCKAVFLLRKDGQLSNKEIAQRLNISVNTVEQHIRKARSVLRKSMNDYEFAFVFICLLNS
jgi:RNA polymerase sigma-70 factor (family 1)